MTAGRFCRCRGNRFPALLPAGYNPGMSDERKKAGVWPLVAALLTGLPVLYVGLFGPGCWLIVAKLSDYGISPSPLMAPFEIIYRPLIYAVNQWMPDPIRDAICRYSGRTPFGHTNFDLLQNRIP